MIVAKHPIVVILASAGRADLLGDLIYDLAGQSTDFELVLSVPDDESLPPHHKLGGATVVRARGLAAQRNAGLDVVPDAEFVFFFDDDAVVRSDYLERGVAFFRGHPDVIGITGRVLLDGATGEEIPRDRAHQALAESLVGTPIHADYKPHKELYGCNFAFRPAQSAGERFDARLPLYSWLEDHDFACRLLRHGKLAKVGDCVVVHMGTKSGGRTAHGRLGYSQMMNPVYLFRSGSFPLGLAVKETVFRVGKNLARSIAGPERHWRRERLRGNALAFADVIRGRLTPERIVDLPARPARELRR